VAADSFDNKGSVRALFVDFKNAYNIVSHNILLTKLKNFNISHCLLKWFASYLFHRCQRVRVGSQVSSWMTLCGSMCQGSRFGPLSFIVMIDDLRANCEVRIFVDDTILSELITPSSYPSDMTDYLSPLLTWTASNDMQLNTSKTKEMILGHIDSTSNPSLSTPVGPIQRVTTFKLLGLHLDAGLSWTTHDKQVNNCTF